jgi:HEAT repeat protein
MGEQEQPLSDIIHALLYTDGEMLHAHLTRLSGLAGDGLGQFTRAWKHAEVDRRLLLAGRLAQLAEDDFTLDFLPLFKAFLDDPEPGLRVRAVAGLELEDKLTVVRPLMKTLAADESAEVREAAARALGKYALMAECGELPEAAGQDIFEALLGVLESASEQAAVRRRALESIAPFRQEVVENYIEDFYHGEDPSFKAGAIFAMGRNCNSRWLEFLLDEMQGGNAEFRFEAARACGEIGDEEAVPGLIALLSDTDGEVQEAAIAALGKIGGDEARRTLKKLAGSHEDRTREAAASALAELEICEDPLSSTS